ncbi:MAG: hypothetical protein Q9191_001520, partial [Dirinaria sp. TL-2023a]
MLLKYTLLFHTIYFTCGRAVNTLPLACPPNLEPLPSPTSNLALPSTLGTQSGKGSLANPLPNPPNPHEIVIRGGTRVKFGKYGGPILAQNIDAVVADTLWAISRGAIINQGDSLIPFNAPFKILDHWVEIKLETISSTGGLQLKSSQVADAVLAMQVLARNYRMLSAYVEIWTEITLVGLGYVMYNPSMPNEAAGNATGTANVT